MRFASSRASASLKELHHHYPLQHVPGRLRSGARRLYIAIHPSPSVRRFRAIFHFTIPSTFSRVGLLLQVRRQRANGRPAEWDALRERQSCPDEGRKLSAAETRRRDWTIEASDRDHFSAPAPKARASLLFSVKGTPSASTQTAHVLYDKQVREHAPGSVAPGPITFEVENAPPPRGGTFFFFFAVLAARRPRSAKAPISFLPFPHRQAPAHDAKPSVTSFRSEVIQASEGIGIKGDHAAVHGSQGFHGPLTIVSATSMPSRWCSSISSVCRMSTARSQWRHYQDDRRRRHGRPS